ncbi:MAG TPA: hypothetical protein VFN57_05300, partial [Thermomicrobiaceae bacterium]|nr:hypothetical protein [Thermomicrobiaceae bacterium]
LGQVLGYPTALVVGALGMLTAAAWFAGSPVPRLRAMPDPAGEETVEDGLDLEKLSPAAK